MGLLGTTTHYQYYNQSNKWLGSEGATSGSVPRAIFTFPTDFTHTPANESEFIVTLNGQEQDRENYTYASGVITFQKKTVDNVTSTLSSSITIAETDTVIAVLSTQVLGDYRYISLKNIVNNFMVAYVGDGKLINTVKRSEILFHAKRCIQEFNYDIGRVEKIQEIDVPPSLSIPMPQDYINYVRISWIDTAGIEHIIYPTRLTSKPSEAILQDSDYDYLYSSDGDTLTGTSLTDEYFREFELDNVANNQNQPDEYLNRVPDVLGQRYGLNPELAQQNGIYVIDEVNGKISFSNGLKDRTITLKYISDGLGTDIEMKIHKFAEEAMYKTIVYSVLSTRKAVPEYIINRYRKERRAAMRNAKIRLSNLKFEELTQVMRGKSKRIKS